MVKDDSTAEEPKAPKRTKVTDDPLPDAGAAKVTPVTDDEVKPSLATQHEQAVIQRNRERYDARMGGESMADINAREAADKAAAKGKG